jgi:hypothetical protein
MEKETFASIVTKVDMAIKPLGFEIWKTERRYMTGPFAWGEDTICTDNSRHELEITVACVKETSDMKGTSSTAVVSRIEEPMVSLGFDISNIARKYIPADRLPESKQIEGQVIFKITFVRVGELK